ncbi:methionyl-tRNA formyltransferase [Campylobacter porcelli]|uniref:Formyltransferase domain-containing protein n=1 Tax=Campylobacter porcelli TaxID=1660073 RepID=A0A1X9SUG3_9BACT|nr:methionyl-tRNA formyltransferase [Campylobacter sp. RM6137]ARQ99864.1 formyltransferase domain-containing protein [Campylobacter sp. RM6137]
MSLGGGTNLNRNLKIGYFADGIWSHNAFKIIIKDPNMQIAFICVRNGSDDEILAKFAKDYGIEILKHKDINSLEFISKIAKFKCDILVSMSFDQIFKRQVIDLTPLGAINCHAGALPFYRGRNILNWALINDEKSFGITVHYIDEGIDTGDIILQKHYEINDSDDYSTLLQTAHNQCGYVLYEALKMILGGDFKPIKQSNIDKYGFYCTQRKFGDEMIDWNQNSRDVFNFIRAITHPAPLARAIINDKEMKIIKAIYHQNAPTYKCVNGAIVGISKNGFWVKCADKALEITEFEYEGRIKIGDRFKIS